LADRLEELFTDAWQRLNAGRRVAGGGQMKVTPLAQTQLSVNGQIVIDLVEDDTPLYSSQQASS
jgi:hypothetical protein